MKTGRKGREEPYYTVRVAEYTEDVDPVTGHIVIVAKTAELVQMEELARLLLECVQEPLCGHQHTALMKARELGLIK